MSSPSNSAVSQYEQAQLAALNKGTTGIESAFSGYTPSFYNQRATDYETYAMPQLGAQYRETYNKLNLGLANQGILRGSAAQNLNSALTTANLQQEEGVVNTAQQQEQQLEQQVAGQKSELYGQLQESLNPTAVTQSAVNTAAQTAAPSTFAPLGQAFSNFASIYMANNAANTYNPITAAYLYNPYALNAGLGASPANPFSVGGGP